MRAFATVLVVPLAWAVSFATFAAVGVDALSLKGASGFMDALVMPLVAIALLWVAVMLPKSLARMAMFGASSGGLIGRTASYLATRRVDAALVQAVPTTLGGKNRGAPSVKSGERSTTGTRHGQPGTATTKGGAPASRPAIGSTAASTTTPKCGGWKPPAGFEGAVKPPGAGLRRPSWREVEHRVPVELAALRSARYRRRRATAPTARKTRHRSCSWPAGAAAARPGHRADQRAAARPAVPRPAQATAAAGSAEFVPCWSPGSGDGVESAAANVSRNSTSVGTLDARRPSRLSRATNSAVCATASPLRSNRPAWRTVPSRST